MQKLRMLGVVGLLLAAAAHAQAAEEWLSARVLADREALVRGEPFRLAVVLDIAPGYHINANPPSADNQIPTEVKPEGHPTIEWAEVQYPKGKPLAAEWAAGGSVSVYSGRVIIIVRGRVSDGAPLGETVVRLTLKYQGCDANTCFRPASRRIETPVPIVEKGTWTPPTNQEVFAEAEKTPPAAGAGAIEFEGETEIRARLERALEHSFFLFLGLCFLLGLLVLNLTPCVFPLIPVTMNFFAQQGESRPVKVLPLAFAYVLGLATTFAVVGVLAALAGKSLGVVLQSPWGVLGLVVVLAAMMAGMFGAFEIQLPSGMMGKLGGRRGVLGAAFMGLVMGAIAAPCVGPILGALIAIVAAAGSIPFGAAAFFAVGIGLGVPHLFLGTFTGLINRFPRSGGWLVWVKRLMGTTLAGLIFFFLRPFIEPAFFWLLVLGVFLFAAVYLGFVEGWSRRPFSRRFWAVRLVTAVAILAVGVGLYTFVTADRPEVEWRRWEPGALEAAQDQGRPVLLYFGADWCAECISWHYRIFAHPKVVEASEDLARLYVDVTRLEEGPKKALALRFRADNPPVVVVFGPAGNLVKAYRNPPKVEAFVGALREATGDEP